MSGFHTPALQEEIIGVLQIEKGEKYIDGTVGGGELALGILKRGGRVLGIDLDHEALEYTMSKIIDQDLEKNLILVRGNFREIKKIAHENGFNQAAGVLFDLGVSSHQLDEPRRGFSFKFDTPLDMRMDPSGSEEQVSAKDLINGLTRRELYELFTKLGQEKRALAISDRIVRARKIKPIETTGELAMLVRGVYGESRIHGIHPATKVFQALRIAVNDELNNIRIAIPNAYDLLKNDGRMIVISFHSLEDRIVKKTFLDLEKKENARILTRKPVRPKEAELQRNPRARSARMRAIQKIE